jgi:glycosyltransferase involved in cell wall biosynthesis
MKLIIPMEEQFIRNPRVMVHIIMPTQISGPNTAAKLIVNSKLSKKYKFEFLVQKKHAGGKISILLIRDLIKQIKTFDPDIIHLSGLQSSAFHAVIAARLCGKKNILIAIRGSATDSLELATFKKKVFGTIVEPLTLKFAHSVYTVCESMSKKSFIKKYSNNFIGTIHNSAPIIDKNSLPKVNFRRKNNFDSDKIIVAIVGRMVFDKGISYITTAIKQIKRDNICYLFIGDGPELLNIETELNYEISINRVFLLGKRNDVLSLLRECDIFLFATLHENLSNALLEACSSGLAIIATNVGGNPEVIQDKYNGLLIPPADSHQIKEAILFLAENRSTRIEYGKNALVTATEKFSQKSLLNRLANVYNFMIDIKL